MRSPLEVRYRFGPLERRGWIGALRPGQVGILAAAVFFTVLLVQALKNGLGLLGGVLLLSTGALLTFVPLYGRPLNEWVPVIGVFMARKATGRNRFRSRAPEAGTRFAGGDEPVSLPDTIGKVELLAFPFRGVELGVLADRPNHTFSAVIQARARSFVLLDPVDKAHRLAGWAGVIAGLAREGSPISRVQWIERTAPDDPDALSRYLREAIDPSIGLDALPLQSYLRLTHAAAPVTDQHELYIVLQLNASKAGRAIKQAGGKDTGACMVLARELETMARRLESAEVEVLHALGPRRLAATIRLSARPGQPGPPGQRRPQPPGRRVGPQRLAHAGRGALGPLPHQRRRPRHLLDRRVAPHRRRPRLPGPPARPDPLDADRGRHHGAGPPAQGHAGRRVRQDRRRRRRGAPPEARLPGHRQAP
jgi:hypothetical protein